MCQTGTEGGATKGGRKIHSPMVGQKTRGGDRQESQGETREEGK